MATVDCAAPGTAPGQGLSDRERSGWTFSQIASLAHTVERFGVMLIPSGPDDDPRDLEALAFGVQALAAQIGLLADQGARMNGASAARNSDPAAWLLPPAFNDADWRARNAQ